MSKALVAVVSRPNITQLMFIAEQAEPKVDPASDPTRLGSHIPLHESAVDQLVILAIRHGQQVFGSVQGLVFGRDSHAHRSAPGHRSGRPYWPVILASDCRADEAASNQDHPGRTSLRSCRIDPRS